MEAEGHAYSFTAYSLDQVRDRFNENTRMYSYIAHEKRYYDKFFLPPEEEPRYHCYQKIIGTLKNATKG